MNQNQNHCATVILALLNFRSHCTLHQKQIIIHISSFRNARRLAFISLVTDDFIFQFQFSGQQPHSFSLLNDAWQGALWFLLSHSMLFHSIFFCTLHNRTIFNDSMNYSIQIHSTFPCFFSGLMKYISISLVMISFSCLIVTFDPLEMLIESVKSSCEISGQF